MIDDRVRNRIKKLLALAERGIGGEKETAKRMLDKMLEKNNLSLEDIRSDRIKTHWLKHQRGMFSGRLLNQTIYAVCGKRDKWQSTHRKNQIGVDCSEYERVQIELQYRAYQKAIKSELELAYQAFLHANDIFPSTTDGEIESNQDDLDLDYLERLSGMASSMRKVQINKELPKS